MNRLYLVFVLYLVSLSSGAQTLYPRIGLTASVNTYRPADYDVTPRIGFLVGVGYNHKLSEFLSVQVALDYVQKSYETDFSSTTSIKDGDDVYDLHVDFSDQYAISYMEMPVLLKAKILHKDFFVLGGFSVGMGLGGSHKYDHYSNASYFGETHEEGSGKIKFGDGARSSNEDAYFDNRWDLGLNVGFGALILKKLQLEFRYVVGTVNLIDRADSKNRCLQFSIATPLKLK